MEIFECTIRLEDYLKKEFENDNQKRDSKIEEEFF